jgi:sugar transferase EpsL
MIKRIIDITVSATLLIALCPAMLIVAALVRMNFGTPVLFRQSRPGLHGKQFDILKFRTMLDATDANGRQLPDSQRLTRFGKWLRASSLDELPELLNVLRGDMSLVGPRPLLVSYLPLYSKEQSRRHDVKPGLTGWAQVNGRNALSWEQKFALDVWYVDHHSIWLDLKILLMTAWKVLKREDISSDGHATMPPFSGNKGG